MSDPPPPIRQLGTVLWDGIPTTCPGCGAAVDQAEACRAAAPACRFCRDPLPCTPSPQRAVAATGTLFVAELQLLGPRDGGRKAPIFSGYRPTFTVAAAPVVGTITFDPPDQVVLPGETVGCSVELLEVVLLDAGQPFDVVEGKHTIGRGTVQLVL